MSIPGPGDILRHELPNGIVVLARENFASPSVVVSGYVEAGARDEPAEQAGLAGFAADSLTRGTAQRSFREIYEAVESVGASFGVGSGTQSTGFGGKSLAEDLPLVLDLLSDVLRAPTFPADGVEKVRGEILTDLEERTQNTARMAGLTFHALAYPPEHPYSRSAIGYTETIRSITRDDLLRFYRQHFGPAGTVIAVVGAVKAETALAQVEAAFGDWDARVAERLLLPPVPRLETVQQRFVPVPGKTQSDVVLGCPGPARSEPDYLDAALANTVLGVFGMMGRLGEAVREKQGLAYYVYSRLDGGMGPGPWRVIAGVNPANVERAVSSILDEIRRLQDELVPEDELGDSQAYLTGSLPLHIETNDGVAQSILNIERYGLGLDYLQRYSGLIQAITPARVQAAAQRWLSARAYALAVAGPPNNDEG